MLIKKYLLLVFTALIIILLLPRGAVVEIQIEVGNTWDNPTIYAPYDIPLIKSSEQLEADEQLLLDNYQPIFKVDPKIFSQDDSLLISLYSLGIISDSDSRDNQGKTIRIARGNSIESVHINALPTPVSLQLEISPNLYYDDKLNAISRDEYLSINSLTSGIISSGDVVIARGQVIDKFSAQSLKSYYSLYKDSLDDGTTSVWIIIAKLLILMMVLGLNLMFFDKFSTFYFGTFIKPLIFIFGMYIIMSFLVSVSENVLDISPFVVPIPIVAIYLLTFFNMRVAVFGNISVSIICALFTLNPFAFFVVNFICGMISIIMMHNMYHRADLFKTVGIIFGVELLLILSFDFLGGTTFNKSTLYLVSAILINNFLILAFYQAIYLIERIFGFVSDLTLLELSDTNQKLLLTLAQQAPGTFQHSVQVANLAEGAATAIGARSLLARCGAMYHDVGKMKNAFYFIENLTGTFNPHDDLTPEQSVEVIKSHVIDGVEVAKQENLPRQVIDFIEQHHGNSVIYYFYAKVKDNVDINIDDYRYPGKNPTTKEVSICMMADAVEAASRSLSSYQKEPLEELVDTIIDTQMREGLFANSELSFAEVAIIKDVFKKKLNNIYHGRIAYPSKK